MLNVYGLRNCDTCRKARAFLEDHGIAHSFVDVRADGVSAEQVGHWADEVGWEALLNRRGTTWRKLDDDAKGDLDRDAAVLLMATHPALIKRPLFETRGRVFVGFGADVLAAVKG